MATTESIMNTNLTILDNTDKMETGTSPFPVDDIEFDLEDDVVYADDNSMLDDAPASIDPTQPDDHMYDEMYDEEIVFEDDPEKADYEMNAGEHDHVESHDFEIQEHEDVDTHTVYDSKVKSQHDQEEVDEASAEETHEPELVDEEEDTNLHNHSSIKLDQHNPGITYETEKVSNDTSQSAPAVPTTDLIDTQNFALEDTHEAETNNVEDVAKTVEVDQSEHVGEEISVHLQEAHEETEVDNESAHFRSPTPAEIHPVTVDYAGIVYSLFPTRDQSSDVVALLEDPAMALLPINSLLKELHKPVADYLGHEDEIVLDIHSLGLHICEDSKYALELTLSQIIDIYMMLSQNQALGHIEPLHCNLSHRTCLRTQMQYLVDSARAGKTYAEIVEEHSGSPEQGDTQQEEDTFDDLAEVEATAEDFYDDEDDERLPTIKVVEESVDVHATEEDHEVNDIVESQVEIDSHETHVDDETAIAAEDVPQQHIEDQEHVNGDDSAEHELNKISETSAKHESIDEPENQVEIAADDDVEEEAEDLFADGAFDDDPVEGENNVVAQANGESNEVNEPSHTDIDDFDFDEWDKEAQLEEDANKIAPVTPTKSLNSKRKADETDDEFEIEFTPQPKKTRST